MVAAAWLAAPAPVNPRVEVGAAPPVPVATPETVVDAIAVVVSATVEEAKVETATVVPDAVDDSTVGDTTTTELVDSTAVVVATAEVSVDEASTDDVDSTSVVVVAGATEDVAGATEEVAGAAPAVLEKSTQISPLTVRVVEISAAEQELRTQGVAAVVMAV
jgi:hypothetical protein